MTKTATILLAILMLSCVAVPVLAGPAHLTEAIRRLEGQEASFTQRFLPKGYKNEQVESGTVVFGESPKSRWDYDTPEAKTFVFDGTTSWMHVPADETVTIHKVSETDKARLPFVLLSSPADLAESFDYTERGERMILTARNKDQLLSVIVVEVNEQSGVISQLQYEDQQGNKTTFELAGWRKATPAAETFSFDPPDGADVIQN